MEILTKLFYRIKKITKKTFVVFGVFFCLQLILSFTSLPFWMYYWLGNTPCVFKGCPDYIIVLGGGGIPSESGLMRTYHTALLSKEYPKSKIIIALPGDTTDCESSVSLMKNELITRGIDSTRISFENEGLNTRMQALKISERLNHNAKIIVITSPDHMYRATKSFQKAGLKLSCGKPACNKALEISLEINDDLGGNECLKKIGKKQQLRYQFWNHLKYLNIVYREYFAITYYKIRGWL